MELVRFPSPGGFSVRRIFTFALAVITAVLLWMALSSTPVHAAPTATWQGEDTLLFDNHGYVKAPDFKDPTGTIPGDAIVYKSTVQPATEGSPDQKLLVLYFANGLDPPTAENAQFVEFTYKNGEVSNPQGEQSVTVTPADESGNSGSSCSVEGIGWIVCPVSNFLADAMDNIFGMLSTFIAVKPMVLGDTSNSMYIAWNTMRSFANIVFVIAFLIIIYSQITSLGISNYGLKKLIPRLVVAAVLVNLSYYITAVALDVSNVLGYSIQDLFNVIREETFSLTNDNLSGINTANEGWAKVTAVALGAGGLIGGVWYLASGAIYLLIPVLIGLILTAILVLVVLAARQAIIVILVIISPLAFVANLLPNTEKLFEKWKDLFITMLVFFPAFSLVFGGSQLAGQIIIQNAGDNIIMLIFGMAVQIAPLVITPLILKLSGSLLGRIAQLANNPNKGLLDRSRNWAGKRAELRKSNTVRGFKPFEKMEPGDSRRAKIRKALSNTANAANRATIAPGRPFVRGLDNMSRNLDTQLETAKLEATNRYEDKNKKYSRLNGRKATAEDTKAAIHAEHATHHDRLRTTPGTAMHAAALRAEEAGAGLKTAQEDKTTYYNRMRATGGTALNRHAEQLATSQAFNKSAEADGAAYLDRRRATNGSPLNIATDQLLHSEHKAERWNNTFEAYKSQVVLNNKQIQVPGSGSFTTGIGDAARLAASSKEHAETAQTRVQAMFDRDRVTAGTVLNTSTVTLENAKIGAEGAKANLATYVTDLKSTQGAALHTEAMRTERSKQAQQLSESRLTSVIEEYKSGELERTGELGTIMTDMKMDAITLAAEKQRHMNAQYEVQRNFASTMTGEGPLTDQIQRIAQGVGGETARVRSQAQAVKATRSLDNEALNANVELLTNEAQASGTNIKRYSADLVSAFQSGLPMFDGKSITDERLKAALQAQAIERNIPLFERALGDTRFNQEMVREIIALNSAAFKGAGGFGLQDDPTLNIENFDTSEEFMHALRTQRISNLANTNASGIAGLKAGWVVGSLADPTEMKLNIGAALLDAALGDKPDATADEKKTAAAAKASLQGAYKTVRDALDNDQIRATMNDREGYIRTLEAELARIHGQAPLPSEPLEIAVDAATYMHSATDDSSTPSPAPTDTTDTPDTPGDSE